MVSAKRLDVLDVIVLAIMVVITVLNTGLALNFVIPNSQALTEMLSTEIIFLIATAELAAVLLAYIFHRQQVFRALA